MLPPLPIDAHVASVRDALAKSRAAVLVDPFDVDDIARGLLEAADRSHELSAAARRRAAELTWARSAELTLAVYRELAP